jgi:hypothetical protein
VRSRKPGFRKRRGRRYKIAVKSDVLLRKNHRRKLWQGNRPLRWFPERCGDGFRKRLLCVVPQRYKVAVSVPNFAMGGYIRTDDSATGKQALGNGQAETLRDGGSGKRFTPRIAPLQLRFRQPLEKMNAQIKVAAGHQPMDTAGFRSGDANDDQLHLRIDLSEAQQAIEGPDQQWDVFVAAMLCNTQEERLTMPARDWRLCGTERLGFDAVVDSDCFSPRSGQRILP